MRIGTWNLAGRWTPAHLALVLEQACDVWLLTEVSDRTVVDGLRLFPSVARMAPRRYWAAVLTGEPATVLPDPHPASAAAVVGDTTFCSSVLPWRSCGSQPPWVGTKHADRTHACVATLDTALPAGQLVWGGDFNHALTGPEHAGSIGGRTAVQDLLTRRGLKAPTNELPHRIAGIATIDHIAVAADRVVSAARRVDATGLSDHDCYVLDVE